MVDVEDAKLVVNSTRDSYGAGAQIWKSDDLWNTYKRAEISRFVEKCCLPLVSPKSEILNVGSGGDGYNWLPPDTVNVDLFASQVEKLPLAVTADVMKLPFRDEAFDLILCTGSVINYCSVIEALREMRRVLKTTGLLVFDFESSASFEHFGRRQWNSTVARVETFYGSRTEHLWVYAPRFVKELLTQLRFKTLRRRSFHIASSAIYLLTGDQERAARFARLDLLSRPFSFFADDHIILVQKSA
jgi:SAM-dependent methyltransferase